METTPVTIASAIGIAQAQRSLARLGLYLGNVDVIPGPMMCDAMVQLLGGVQVPQVGLQLSQAIPRVWWTTPNRVNMLFAQVFTECGFRSVQEDLNYSPERLRKVWPRRFDPEHGATSDAAAKFAHNPQALATAVYSGRDGNCTPTDGWTYRGRGWPQLTGRANYRAFSDAGGVNLETNPDAALRLDVTARITVAYMTRTLGLLAAADAGDVAQVRHLWNGGANGLSSAQLAFTQLATLWEAP